MLAKDGVSVACWQTLNIANWGDQFSVLLPRGLWFNICVIYSAETDMVSKLGVEMELILLGLEFRIIHDDIVYKLYVILLI